MDVWSYLYPIMALKAHDVYTCPVQYLNARLIITTQLMVYLFNIEDIMKYTILTYFETITSFKKEPLSCGNNKIIENKEKSLVSTGSNVESDPESSRSELFKIKSLICSLVEFFLAILRF